MSGEDEGHLRLLRAKPCAVATHRFRHNGVDYPQRVTPCAGTTEAHHPTGAGMALRSHDHAAIPLCTWHHKEFHDAKGTFWGWPKAQRKAWQAAMSELYKPDDEVF